MNTSNVPFSERDIEWIRQAIGPAARVAYAATHVYPMGAPDFRQTPAAQRYRPNVEVMRLYAHIPFCNYACSFCFFATKVGSDRAQMDTYVSALLRELEWVPQGTGVSQLFVGGGTPTTLPPDLLDRLLGGIFRRMPHAGSGVHTIETSPESVSAAHLEVIRDRGIGRVSMGIQSLDERVLARVNRRHGKEEALRACRLLVDSGLIVNIDLIYGLPNQSHESFRRDMQLVAETGVQSMTLYNLRLNELTPLAKFLSEEQRLYLGSLMNWRQFVAAAAEELGYSQTRWHTFKRLDSIAARHERLPCFNGQVGGYQFGIGSRARSHLGSAVYRNQADFKNYLDRIQNDESPVEETFTLNQSDRKTQFVARSLGDGQPLNRQQYRTDFGCELEEDFGELLARLMAAGLIDRDPRRIWLTDVGRLVYDVITLAFYPVYAREWMQNRQQLNFGQNQKVSA